VCLKRAREANAVRSTRRLVAAIAAVALLGVASTRPAAQAKYGGVLVYGQTIGAPDSLDPTLYRSVGSVEIFDAICQGLYSYGLKLHPAPQLATSMPTISPDKLTYTIHLRQGGPVQ
jgi:peptide/nickel transport system substrate-binding protein